MANWFTKTATKVIATAMRAVGIADSDKWFAYFGVGADKIHVNESTALGLPAFYAGVRTLCSVFASLPRDVIEDTPTGSQKRPQHSVSYLIKTRPNEKYSPYIFFFCLLYHALVRGNGYARIKRNGVNRPEAFILYMPWDVQVFEDKNGVYYQTPDGVIDADDIIHIKAFGETGLVGRSLIGIQKETLGEAIGTQRYGRAIHENGTFVTSTLNVPGKLSSEARQRMKDQLSDISGILKAGQTPVLEEGMELKRVMLSPDETKFLEQKKYSRSDIAAIIGVPPDFVGDYENAHYANMEMGDLRFVKYCLGPWIKQFEEEFSYKCFRVQESAFSMRFNLNGLLRGDVEKRGAFFREMWNIGVFSQNTILQLEDMNTFEGGDRHYVQMNMIPVDKIDAQLAASASKSDQQARADQQLLNYLISTKEKNGNASGINGNGSH